MPSNHLLSTTTLVLLLCLVLTGCGGAPDTAPTPPPTSESPKTEVETSPDTPEAAPALAATPEEEAAAAVKLEAEIAAFEVPQPWLASVTSEWDVETKPWSEGRLEIRRLLGENTEETRREAIKLTWDYLQKDDMGDRHEYGMYMFLGNEPLWTIIAYREKLAETEHEYPPFGAIRTLATLYAERGIFGEAEKLLKQGTTMRPPKREWYEMREAEFHDDLGDLYLKWGKRDLAIEHYNEAMRLYPLSKPPYGQHLLPQRVQKIQTKLDLMAGTDLTSHPLSDGVYVQKALGYTGDITVTATVTNGKLSDIALEHTEKIDQNACVIIPGRIVAAQSLQIDGVSGATVTKDAIRDGTLRALRKAGLE